VRPGSEGGELDRHRELGPVGAEALDVAHELRELDGKGNPESGFDCPGTVRSRHGLPDMAGASGHL
jgi:hypothetical protein